MSSRWINGPGAAPGRALFTERSASQGGSLHRPRPRGPVRVRRRAARRGHQSQGPAAGAHAGLISGAELPSSTHHRVCLCHTTAAFPAWRTPSRRPPMRTPPCPPRDPRSAIRRPGALRTDPGEPGRNHVARDRQAAGPARSFMGMRTVTHVGQRRPSLRGVDVPEDPRGEMPDVRRTQAILSRATTCGGGARAVDAGSRIAVPAKRSRVHVHPRPPAPCECSALSPLPSPHRW